MASNLRKNIARVTRDYRVKKIDKKQNRANIRHSRDWNQADGFTTPEEKEAMANGEVSIDESMDHNDPNFRLHSVSAMEETQKEFADKKLAEKSDKLDKKRNRVEQRYSRIINK